MTRITGLLDTGDERGIHCERERIDRAVAVFWSGCWFPGDSRNKTVPSQRQRTEADRC